jgi:hypothetical protein
MMKNTKSSLKSSKMDSLNKLSSNETKKQTLPSSKTSTVSGSVISNLTQKKEMTNLNNLKKNLQK